MWDNLSEILIPTRRPSTILGCFECNPSRGRWKRRHHWVNTGPGVKSRVKLTGHSPECKKGHNCKCDKKLDHQDGIHLKKTKKQQQFFGVCMKIGIIHLRSTAPAELTLLPRWRYSSHLTDEDPPDVAVIPAGFCKHLHIIVARSTGAWKSRWQISSHRNAKYLKNLETVNWTVEGSEIN